MNCAAIITVANRCSCWRGMGQHEQRLACGHTSCDDWLHRISFSIEMQATAHRGLIGVEHETAPSHATAEHHTLAALLHTASPHSKTKLRLQLCRIRASSISFSRDALLKGTHTALCLTHIPYDNYSSSIPLAALM